MKKLNIKSKKNLTKKINMISINNSELELDKLQPIFLGIDVHKKKWSFSIIHADKLVKRATIEGDFEQLKKTIARYKGYKIYSVYEAGFSGFHLHRSLEKIGVKNIVTPPNKIPTIVGDKVKTDKKDSLKLATMLSKNMLKAINVPSVEMEDFRQIMRTRDQFIRQKKTKVQHIKSLLIRFGIAFEARGLPKNTIHEIRELQLPLNIKRSLEYHIDTFLFLKQKIKKLENDAKELTDKSSYSNGYEILNSIPGIGHVTSSFLIGEIGDWNRFKNAKQISAFFGLTPSEYSSGEYVHKGRITGQGKDILRSLMVESSWVLIKKDFKMRLFYDQLVSNSKSKKKAIVGVARKLVCIMFTMMKNKKCYELDHKYIQK
jgi:transposase